MGYLRTSFPAAAPFRAAPGRVHTALFLVSLPRAPRCRPAPRARSSRSGVGCGRPEAAATRAEALVPAPPPRGGLAGGRAGGCSPEVPGRSCQAGGPVGRGWGSGREDRGHRGPRKAWGAPPSMTAHAPRLVRANLMSVRAEASACTWPAFLPCVPMHWWARWPETLRGREEHVCTPLQLHLVAHAFLYPAPGRQGLH